MAKLISYAALVVSTLFSVPCANLSAFAATHTVELVDFMFVPMDLTISEGDTVRWVWNTDNHNVVAGLPYSPNGAFESLVENTGYSYEITFDRQFLNNNRKPNNRYDYYCTPHATDNMLGSVTVNRQAIQFAAQATSWQIFPPTESSNTSNCTAVLNSEQTLLDINCVHQTPNISSVQLRSAPLGRDGPVVCTFTAPNFNTASCALSIADVEALFAGEMHLIVSSSTLPDGEIRGHFVMSGGQASVAGFVRTPTGSPISGVTLTLGSNTLSNNSDGSFLFSNIANGVYQFSASHSSLNIIPNPDTNPLVVNSLDLSNRSFSSAPSTTCGLDSDADSVCDIEELTAGSDRFDRGSLPPTVSSPVAMLWNGFLQMVNILEVVNKDSQAHSVTLLLYDIMGSERHRHVIELAAKGQTDVIVNDLPGFAQNSYGLLRLEYAAELVGKLDGRLFFYRPSAGGEFEFAFGVPWSRANYGISAVAFNTFQPSRHPAEQSNTVAQWLSLVNLDQAETRTFAFELYSQSGGLISRETVSIPASGRRDLAAGHERPGPNQVGLARIVPDDYTAPYLALLTRYGEATPAATNAPQYSFAYVLPARAGNGNLQFAPISVGAGGENWLELVNSRENSVSVQLEAFSNQGQRLVSDQFLLAPYAQRHINTGSLLPPGGSGTARVLADAPDSLLGQSMVYFRNAQGSIEAMYGSALRENFGNLLAGSYNLYLSMYNWLKLTNTSERTQTVVVSLYPPGRSPVFRIFELRPNVGFDLGLHEGETYGTQGNEFGLVTLSSDEEKAVFSEILRLRPSDAGGIDFSAATAVR